jgi:hypothetical protein
LPAGAGAIVVVGCDVDGETGVVEVVLVDEAAFEVDTAERVADDTR